MTVHIELTATTPEDAQTLVRMRIEAMRESLERIGRFDPQRARDRFLASFDSSRCRFIVNHEQRVGFIQFNSQHDHWLLEHLYVTPGHQGQGIGSAALSVLVQQADAAAQPIRLDALRGSDSNRFYQRHGFVPIDESEWDIHYLRQPR